MDIGPENLIKLLQTYPRSLIFTGTCDVGCTVDLIIVAGARLVNDEFKNCIVEHINSLTGAVQRSVVITNNAAGLVLNPVLLVAPNPGDTIVVFNPLLSLAVLNINLSQVGGTAQTGADWTPLLQHLNLDISDLLGGITGAGVAAKTLGDINTTLLINVAGGNTLADIGSILLTDIANGSSLANIVTALANMSHIDLDLSNLQDAITGVGATAKTLADIDTAIGNLVQSSTTPTVYNIAMTLANTEYSQALPANTRKFTISLQEGDTAYRLAFVTGKVAAPTAPYINVGAGQTYYEDGINITGKTIYCACNAAGRNLQIVCWT